MSHYPPTPQRRACSNKSIKQRNLKQTEPAETAEQLSNLNNLSKLSLKPKQPKQPKPKPLRSDVAIVSTCV